MVDLPRVSHYDQSAARAVRATETTEMLTAMI
jgi:hypothetical protein